MDTDYFSGLVCKRFMSKVTVRPDGCWLWTSTRNAGGYGKFNHGPKRARRTAIAHRWAYTEFVGPVPDGLVLDHLCRNRACVNPDHLEAVTQRVNVQRGYDSRVSA